MSVQRLSLLFVYLLLGIAHAAPPVAQFAVESEPAEGQVQNGRAYEYGPLDLQGVDTVTLPPNFKVDSAPGDADAAVALRKVLAFKGQPPKPITIIDGRRWMGLALRREGRKLTLATFGEWQSKEGGARLEGRVWLPKRVHVKRDAKLAGSESRAQGKEGASESSEGYWYAARTPGNGWTALVTNLDSAHRFDKQK